MFSAQLELLPWVQKGDKNFYNEALAGVNLELLPHPPQKTVVFGERVIEVPLFAYEIKVPTRSETPGKVWVSPDIEPVLSAIGHALGVWGSKGLAGQDGVKQLGQRSGYAYSVPLNGAGAHAVLSEILGVGLLKAGTLAAEIKASLGIEFHCYAPDGAQWLA